MAKCIMVQGTMSSVGKSLLTAALCRIFRQDGWTVAPFKSQNMALNSYITRDGLELGRAQAMQAQAAGIEPDVRMNPILLKPNSDTGSQVIVNGILRDTMNAAAYFRKKRELIPDILAAYRGLASEYDIIVIEGAGSPAEINLRENDIVNMGLAELVNAPVLLVGDIDRGGVFAQLYGTVALLRPEERRRLIGTVINRFRGDVDLLRPGLRPLEELTGVPVLGVVPCLPVDLDDEDSLAPRLSRRTAQGKALDLAVIRLPHLSNFTDFAPLDRHPAMGVRYVDSPARLGSPDCIILPGTKNTLADLAWLRESGLADRILAHAKAGRPVLGVCGGYQMLGRRISDPDGVERGGSETGLGLLDCETEFVPEKYNAQVQATGGAYPFVGCPINGYEVHMGRTAAAPGVAPFCVLSDGRREGAVQGTVWGTYLHGLFDSAPMVNAFASFLLARRGESAPAPQGEGQDEYRERQFDLLADTVRKSLDMDMIYREMERYANEQR